MIGVEGEMTALLSTSSHLPIPCNGRVISCDLHRSSASAVPRFMRHAPDAKRTMVIG
jgi:hypothetical protein